MVVVEGGKVNVGVLTGQRGRCSQDPDQGSVHLIWQRMDNNPLDQ